jgi:Coiled-coil N-terminus of cGMP-dependent protein kinase
MRICFDGLCFASRRTATVDVESQTVLGGATALEQNNFLQLLKANSLAATPTSVTKSPQSNAESSASDNKLKSAPNLNSKINNNNNNTSHHKTIAMMMDNNNPMMDISGANTPTMAGDNDFSTLTLNGQANSFTTTTTNSLGSINKISVDDQTELLENLYINVDDDDANMNLTEKEQQLVKVIRLKEGKIKDLEAKLQRKHEEVAELRSHLDKFQSVFPFRAGAAGGAGNRKHGQNHQRQRAQGISAEPQSESSVMQLLNVTFPKYDKDER